jgi:hypothetical protein
MGFRFRRSIKILPGVRINMSKNHPISSVTIGGPKSLFKSNVPVGRSGPATSTIGNLGGLLTGLSYTHSWRGTQRQAQRVTFTGSVEPVPASAITRATGAGGAPSKKSIAITLSILLAFPATILGVGAIKGDKSSTQPVAAPVENVAPSVTPEWAVVQQCREIILRPGYTVDPETVVFGETAVSGDPSSTFTVTQRYSEEAFGRRMVVDQTCNGANGVVQTYSGQLVN